MMRIFLSVIRLYISFRQAQRTVIMLPELVEGLRNFTTSLSEKPMYLACTFLRERVTGIEPVSPPWQGDVIPIYHTRVYQRKILYHYEVLLAS